jgi:hypothetical protein
MHTGGGVYHQWQLDASSDEPCCWADAIAQKTKPWYENFSTSFYQNKDNILFTKSISFY